MTAIAHDSSPDWPDATFRCSQCGCTWTELDINSPQGTVRGDADDTCPTCNAVEQSRFIPLAPWQRLLVAP